MTDPAAARIDGIRVRFWAWAAAMAALLATFGFVVWPSLRVETDIVALLPTEQNAAAEQAVDRFSQALARKVILLVGAQKLETAEADARNVAERLRASGAFADVVLDVNGEMQDQVALYRAHRGSLLSERQRALLAAGGDEQLLREARRAAFTPEGVMRALRLVDDPLGLGTDYLRQQMPALGAARLDGTMLIVEGADASYALIAAELAGSPFASETQESAMAAITAGRAALTSGSELLISGTVQHADAIAHRAQNELATFGTIETIAVMILLLVVFGAMRPLALGALTTALAFVAGMTVTQLSFSTVHILALVFGSSLIGGVIDYSIHFFADRFRSPHAWSTRDAYDHVGGAIVLGLTTTLLGYAVLLLMPFPGLRQMATFCVAGLIVGCTTVLCAYPVLYRAPKRSSALGPRAGDALTRRFAGWRWSARNVVLALALLVLAAVGLTRLELQDDVTALQASPRALVQAEKRVAAVLHSALESRYFLVQAADEQSLLEAEERLTSSLDRLIAEDELATYTAVTRSLPSYAKQRETRALLDARVFGASGLEARAWAALGLSAAGIAERVAARPPAALLSPQDWLASPASEPLRPLWLPPFDGRYSSIVTLGGIKNVDALRALAADDGAIAGKPAPTVRLIDRIATITRVLHTYRVSIGWLLVAVYGVAGFVLSRRFGWRDVPSLLAPSAAASLATLALFGWFGVPMNLFTLLSLWLVLGLGVDYGIFLRHGRTALSTAVLSVTLSAITTLLAFGLLAFSATPFIESIGLTLLVSITLSWLFAMLACVPSASGLDRDRPSGSGLARDRPVAAKPAPTPIGDPR